MGRLTRRNFRFDESDYMVSVTAEALNKLAHYEDLEEAGRLKTLGCAVGSHVYFLLLNGEVDSQFIDNIQTALYFTDENGNLKKGFYHTKEEAEAKLEELKGEKP